MSESEGGGRGDDDSGGVGAMWAVPSSRLARGFGGSVHGSRLWFMIFRGIHHRRFRGDRVGAAEDRQRGGGEVGRQWRCLGRGWWAVREG
jgi:hypothetical protein